MKNLLILVLLFGCVSNPAAPIVTVETVQVPSNTLTTFTVKSTLPYLAEVSRLAECVIHDEDFLKEIRSHKQFDFTDLPSLEIEKKLREYAPIIISSYSKRFSKTVAYRNIGSNIIYFNTQKNPRVIKEMVNTAFHEWAHVQGFGHGDNYAKGKENSIPYGGGLIAEKYVEKCLNF